jgi:hypothetical protein
VRPAERGSSEGSGVLLRCSLLVVNTIEAMRELLIRAPASGCLIGGLAVSSLGTGLTPLGGGGGGPPADRSRRLRARGNALRPGLVDPDNELAPDHLRGRYNALSACVWGVTGIIGPPMGTALIATGVSALWISPLVAGCPFIAAATSGLGRRLPARQEGQLPALKP